MNGLKVILLAGVCALATVSLARADDYVDMATKAAKAATARADKWDGPTSGPTAAKGKKIVYVAADLNNGGILGASEGVKEAAEAVGWKVTVIDGQGSVSGRTAAMNQALTLKPDGIVAGGFDPNEQKVAFDTAAKSGAVVVGWHAGTRPGPEPESGIFANVTTMPQDVSNTAAYQAIAESDGKAGVVIFTDSQYEIAVFKAKAMEAAIQKCGGCKVLGIRRLADRRIFPAHAAADHHAPAEVRRQVDAFAGDQRPLFRLHGPVARRGRQEGRRRAAQHFRRRRLGIGVPAHPRQAVPGRHGAGAAQHAGLAAGRRAEPRLQQGRRGRATRRASIS